jgi:hypothetical protein
MSTENSPALPASQKTQPQLSGGLHLTGTVIAVRTEEKEWEKEKYTQTTVSISDGEQVFCGGTGTIRNRGMCRAYFRRSNCA